MATKDPDAFRCIGCETPTRGGRLCSSCRDISVGVHIPADARVGLLQLAAEGGIKEGVYGSWCRDPKICAGKGYCPRDPNCGE